VLKKHESIHADSDGDVLAQIVADLSCQVVCHQSFYPARHLPGGFSSILSFAFYDLQFFLLP